MLHLIINGESRMLPESLTVAQLLERLEYDRKRVAVEINGEVVPVAQHTSRGLQEEDVIEIFLRDFQVVELTRRVATDAIQLRRAHRVRLPDAIIWASARAESALLVTRNSKDFPRDEPGVRIPY